MLDRAGKTLNVLACVCLLSMAALPCRADWRPAIAEARLLGSGAFSWFGVTLYNARLWSPATGFAWNQPFALELTYRRALSRDTLVKASVDEMRRLGGRELDPATLERWTHIMETAFVDVRPGMRITGVYLPGRGCRFYVDDQLRREIDDVAFARAFFAIWLDPQARDPQLRQQLLGMSGDGRGG